MLLHPKNPGNLTGKQIMLEVVTDRRNLRLMMKITTTKTRMTKTTKKPDQETFQQSSTDRTEETVSTRMMKIITGEGKNQQNIT